MNTRRVLVALAVVAAMLPAASQAEFIYGGNTNLLTTASFAPFFDGTVNVAVYRRDGLDASNPYGIEGDNVAGFYSSFTPGTAVPPLSSPADDPTGLETSQQYLYLYQVVNNGTDSFHEIGPMNIVVAPDAGIASWGYFSDFSLKDLEGIVSAGNDMGHDPQVFAANSSASGPGVTSPGVTDIGAGAYADPTQVTYDGIATFFVNFNPGKVPGGSSSVVFGFTANKKPTEAAVTVQNLGQSLNGFTVAPSFGAESPTVPAPTGLLALASLAMVGVGAAYRRRQGVAKA